MRRGRISASRLVFREERRGGCFRTRGWRCTHPRLGDQEDAFPQSMALVWPQLHRATEVAATRAQRPPSRPPGLDISAEPNSFADSALTSGRAGERGLRRGARGRSPPLGLAPSLQGVPAGGAWNREGGAGGGVARAGAAWGALPVALRYFAEEAGSLTASAS